MAGDCEFSWIERKNIGRHILKVKEERHLTFADIGMMVDINAASVKAMTDGRSAGKTVHKVLKALNIPIETALKSLPRW